MKTTRPRPATCCTIRLTLSENTPINSTQVIPLISPWLHLLGSNINPAPSAAMRALTRISRGMPGKTPSPKVRIEINSGFRLINISRSVKSAPWAAGRKTKRIVITMSRIRGRLVITPDRRLPPNDTTVLLSLSSRAANTPATTMPNTSSTVPVVI